RARLAHLPLRAVRVHLAHRHREHAERGHADLAVGALLVDGAGGGRRVHAGAALADLPHRAVLRGGAAGLGHARVVQADLAHGTIAVLLALGALHALTEQALQSIGAVLVGHAGALGTARAH